MKRIFICAVLTIMFFLGICANNISIVKSNQQHLTLRLENMDNISRNILIHSIAFQRDCHVQYANSPIHHFSEHRMTDIPDNLIGLN